MYILTVLFSAHGTNFVFGLSFAEALLFTALYAASRPERRRILHALQLGGATSADTAMTSYELSGDQSRALNDLVRDGVVIATPDDRFYLKGGDTVKAPGQPWWLIAGTTGIVIAGLAFWVVQ